MVVVPRSIASPCSGPVPRSISPPSRRMRSPSRVTAGSSAHDGPCTGSSKACDSMRIVPRRIVWQRITPSSATTLAQHDSRKAPFRCCSGGPRSERASIPSATSTTHSLHFPCLLHEVGTGIPSDSAHVKSESPVGAAHVRPLKCSSTLMVRRSPSGRSHAARRAGPASKRVASGLSFKVQCPHTGSIGVRIESFDKPQRRDRGLSQLLIWVWAAGCAPRPSGFPPSRFAGARECRNRDWQCAPPAVLPPTRPS
jgi:hypothetical protein